MRKNWALFLMIFPVLLYFFIFGYVLMPGAYVAFVNYKHIDGIFGSQFVGFKNFEFLIQNGDLWKITKNTLLYNVAFILVGNFVQIMLAVMISQVANRAFKRLSQSILLFPYFISFVIVGVLAFSMFNYDTGSVNNMLVSMGFEKHDFYSDQGIWKYILLAFNTWKGKCSCKRGEYVCLYARYGLVRLVYERDVY